ncbi:Putative zinc-finger [Sinosporangium album]|uniref:Putative zinc-finger n=1 Tax=Sinosporangium album TaxID=504805 RepID=A0A1G7Y5Y6_9ACTN|nr:zf-HC2 domain-containing protein [Sinosporangium album]SDG91882.1 Putative zinc-finger [Sinosporangium album]
MSHLGERVSAFVDGELSHSERERALAHLTFCAACRAEVDSTRALKSRLRSLDGPAMPTDLTMALLRMAEPGDPLPPRTRPFPDKGASFGGVSIPGPYSFAPLDNRPRRGAGDGLVGPGRSTRNRRRAGYVAVGVASAAVALGTLFVVGGSDPKPVVPPVEMFKQQHNTTVPYGTPGPAAPRP